MRSLHQRQSAARLLLRRVGLLALFVIVLIAASGVWGVYKKERESAELRSQVERERDDLLKRQEQLEGDLALLKTDRGVEEALRSQFALAEVGEKLIVIVEPPSPQPLKATSTVREWLQKALWWW